MVLSQVAVFLHSYRLVTGRDLFPRRRAEPGKEVGYAAQ
jgi:hypothetical protein